MVGAGHAGVAGDDGEGLEVADANVIDLAAGDLAFAVEGFAEDFGFGQHSARRIDHAPIVCQNPLVKRSIARHPGSGQAMLDLGKLGGVEIDVSSYP